MSEDTDKKYIKVVYVLSILLFLGFFISNMVELFVPGSDLTYIIANLSLMILFMILSIKWALIESHRSYLALYIINLGIIISIIILLMTPSSTENSIIYVFALFYTAQIICIPICIGKTISDIKKNLYKSKSFNGFMSLISLFISSVIDFYMWSIIVNNLFLAPTLTS